MDEKWGYTWWDGSNFKTRTTDFFGFMFSIDMYRPSNDHRIIGVPKFDPNPCGNTSYNLWIVTIDDQIIGICTWYDLIWYDMIWYNLIWSVLIWYDMICYDILWYDMWCTTTNVNYMSDNMYSPQYKIYGRKHCVIHVFLIHDIPRMICI